MAIEHTQDNGGVGAFNHERSSCSRAAFERYMAKPETVRIGPNTSGKLCLELSHAGECVQAARPARSKQIDRLRCLMIIKRQLAGNHYHPQQQVRALRSTQR